MGKYWTKRTRRLVQLNMDIKAVSLLLERRLQGLKEGNMSFQVTSQGIPTDSLMLFFYSPHYNYDLV